MSPAPAPLRVITLLSVAQILIAVVVVLSTPVKLATASDKCFKSIISFGDSITDTGNAAYLLRNENVPQVYVLPPYGETYFHRPTGRCSDGRLIIDFLAEELRIPFVKPFHGGGVNGSASVSSGAGFNGSVNFAVVGVTALEDSFLRRKGVEVAIANASLTAQLSWFKQFLSKNCHTSSGCRRSLRSTLMLVGEVGGNDYNLAFLQGRKAEEQVRSLVPQVIKTIGVVINDLINLGGVTLIVPGNFPLGCYPVYLRHFASNNKQSYDSKTGCIKWLNRFSQYHNELLQKELNRIQMLHPHTSVIYADYYNAAMNLYRSPEKYGFTGGVLKACCGSGAFPLLPLSNCMDPSLYVNWDGLHFTEAAHKWMARELFLGSNATIPLNLICSRISNSGFYDS